MQSQHADPHDTIAAQLRALATPRTDDLPGPSVTPAASPEPANEPPVQATPLNDNAGDMRIPISRARSGRNVVFLAICAGTAAAAWHFYGDQAKQRFSDLVPQFLVTAPASTPNTSAAEPQDVASQTAAPQPVATPAPTQEGSNAASTTPALPPEPAPAMPAAEAPPAQAALPPEVTQSLETMAQEIASLKQTVEQLRASQQQLSDDVAKISEHAARQKPVAKPASQQRPRHTPTPTVASRPVAPYSPPQTQPQRQIYPQSTAPRATYNPSPVPTQLPPQPGDSTAPRPPMPLH